MKDVIDVLAMQREKRSTLQKSITIDYTNCNDNFSVARYIFECGKYLFILLFYSFKKVQKNLHSLTKKFRGFFFKLYYFRH